MGMSASQARLLSLTARKSNTEFEGQQINQQRMALSNQSANLNKQSLTMSPPVVPSVTAYTNTVYSWKVGNTTNTVDQIYPAAGTVDYTHTETVPGGAEITNDSAKVIKNTDGTYKDEEGHILKTDVVSPSQLAELRSASPLDNPNEIFIGYNNVFYSKTALDSAQYLADNSTQTAQYAMASSTTKEVTSEGVPATWETSKSGNLTSITVGGKTYNLTATSVKDEDAYNQAMNEYNYQTDLYNKAIEDVNSKLAILQAQDKNLETQLKQLDTEQEAIQTETDAVKKVIDKNIESSFKAFG